MVPLETSGPNVLKNPHLVVLNTPRKTFYSILTEGRHGMFRVLKVRGAPAPGWQQVFFEVFQPARRSNPDVA